MLTSPFILLALMDFLPPVAFAMGAFFLVKLARLKKQTVSTRMLTIGGTLIFLGGGIKAISKLLLALQIAEIPLFMEQQFVLLAPGFLLLFLGVLKLARSKAQSPQIAAMAAWKIPFLAVMTISSIGTNGILVWYAF